MRLELDFDKKIIKVQSNVNIGDLVDKIQKIIPDWQDWVLYTNVEIVWKTPTVIKEIPYTPYTPFWYNSPSVTADRTISPNSGDGNILQIEI